MQSARGSHIRSRLRLVGFAVVLPLALTLVGMSQLSVQASKAGPVVTFAEAPSYPPTYIFPMAPQLQPPDFQELSEQLWPYLYWFGDKGKPLLNESLSIALPPTFSDNNTVVTIALKHWRWSDGQSVTARDVVFWLNMVSAVTDPNRAPIGSNSEPGPAWGPSTPGGFPQNVVKYSATGTYTVVLDLNASYNPTWFLYNELSQIVPVPQQTWDRLSASTAIGNYDASAEARTTLPGTSPAWYVPVTPGTATSGALGVSQFLNSESENLSTYDTDPLWKVVDGPFRLAQFTTSGFVKLVPNNLYSGSPKPSISAFEEIPFTSDAAEFNALRSGSLTIGYLPVEDLAQKATLERNEHYKFNPWNEYTFDYMLYNFTNQAVGPIFEQLYFRQAFQSLINQPEYIRDFQHGIGAVANGPVPSYPPGNVFESPLVKTGVVYPYDQSKAVSLLKANGWTVVPGGDSYCSRPGTGSGDCGAGIAANQTATFKVLYASGTLALTNEMSAMESTMKATAGISLVLSTAPLADVVSTSFSSCTFSAPCNDWQLADWGTGWTYYPDYLPTGEEFFYENSISNAGDFISPSMDADITATNTAPTYASEIKAIFKYEDYAAKDLPVVWLPNGPYQFTMYKSNLKGLVPQGIFAEIYPQFYQY
jgi:peptide/nickel transport system substrate-binding protein